MTTRNQRLKIEAGATQRVTNAIREDNRRAAAGLRVQLSRGNEALEKLQNDVRQRQAQLAELLPIQVKLLILVTRIAAQLEAVERAGV